MVPPMRYPEDKILGINIVSLNGLNIIKNNEFCRKLKKKSKVLRVTPEG